MVTRKTILKPGVIILAILVSGHSTSAQDEKREESKMVVKVAKEGKTVLDTVGDGFYRLEFESYDSEPIIIEVFNCEGDRLFKKKVKNFYGRILKLIKLQDNDTGLFTVRVVQGERDNRRV